MLSTTAAVEGVGEEKGGKDRTGERAWMGERTETRFGQSPRLTVEGERKEVTCGFEK